MDSTPGSGRYDNVPQVDPDLLYDRIVRTRARVVDGQVVVSGWLTDETLGPTGYIRVHDMGLDITCSFDSLTITDVVARMNRHPHGTCPLVLSDMEFMVGMTIGPGFLKDLRSRMGGTRHCNHLYTVAQAVGQVAALTFAARLVHADPRLGEVPAIDHFAEVVAQAPTVINSCRIWREDGAVVGALREYTGDSVPRDSEVGGTS
jgi:hypothetical protein